MKSGQSNSWFFVLAAGGLVLMLTGIWLWRKMAQSRKWMKTSGTILSSNIRREWRQMAGGRMVYFVTPEVSYDYLVNGQKYTGSRVAIIEDDSSYEDSTQQDGLKYSVGQQVDVYFDPLKPSSASLTLSDASNGILAFGMFILGLLTLAAGIYCYW